MATTYEVIITEAQRARIQKGLELLEKQEPLTEEEKQDPDLEYLLACVTEAPISEAECPGIIHGWCL